MRFLCDEMLVRLARLLRAAGYDTALSQGGVSDDEIVRQARAERRIILTRDRTLAARAGPDGLLVSGQGAMGEAEALTRALPLDWALAPFTRCVMDNAAVREAGPGRDRPDAEKRPGPAGAVPRLPRLRAALLAGQPHPANQRTPRGACRPGRGALSRAVDLRRAPRPPVAPSDFRNPSDRRSPRRCGSRGSGSPAASRFPRARRDSA
jgi:hypothetical protein